MRNLFSTFVALSVVALALVVAPLAGAIETTPTPSAPAVELQTAPAPAVELTPEPLFLGDRNCIQVIAYGTNPETGECRQFPTPCDVPSGWTISYTGCAS